MNERKIKMKIIGETTNFIKVVENASSGRVFEAFKGGSQEQVLYISKELFNRGLRRIVMEIEE